jgi:HAD superfamily hydrolase (TIGR01509 family)
VIAYPDIREANRRLADLRPELTMFEVQALRNQPDYYPLWERYSVGGMTSEAYWAAVLTGLGFEKTPDRVDALIDILRSTAWAHLDQTVLTMAQGLRARGLRLGLLSNSAAYHDAAIATFAGAFDIAHFSHRIGLRKPMPAAYLGAARALGVPPEAIVFIDDKRRNTAAAEQLGMRALLFQGAEGLGSALAALGLVDAA